MWVVDGFVRASPVFSLVGESAAPGPSTLVADLGSSAFETDGFSMVPTDGRLAAAFLLLV